MNYLINMTRWQEMCSELLIKLHCANFTTTPLGRVHLKRLAGQKDELARNNCINKQSFVGGIHCTTFQIEHFVKLTMNLKLPDL